jgi:hypothetical protein
MKTRGLDINKLKRNHSLDTKILTKKQLLLKRAKDAGIDVSKTPSVAELEARLPKVLADSKREKKQTALERKISAEKHSMKIKDGPRNGTKFERYFAEAATAKLNGPVDLVIVDSGGNKSKIMKNVVEFRKIEGSRTASPQAYANREYNPPKADIAIVNSDGVDVGWISHKAKAKNPDAKAIGFQQYLRISTKKLPFTGDALKEINEFKRDVVRHAPASKEWPQKRTMWAPIKSNEIKNKAVFGLEFGNRLSRDNITAFGQGDPLIEKKDGIAYLRFSEIGVLNGHLELLKGRYEPVFYARSERRSKIVVSAVVNNVTYKYLTFFIQPFSHVTKHTKLASNTPVRSSVRSPVK